MNYLRALILSALAGAILGACQNREKDLEEAGE